MSAVPFVVSFDAPAPGATIAGGKGANLAALYQAGFAVPRGFCVTVDAFRSCLHQIDLGIRGAHDLEASVARMPLPAEVAGAIGGAVQTHFGPGVALAIRSSAVDEDSAAYSFAGIQTTLLNIRGLDGVLAGIRRCWSSLFRDESLLYRSRIDGFGAMPGMGVVVQRLVKPEVSGVIFTVNPVTGARDEVMICSAYGMGEAVVAGQAADTFTVAKATGEVLRREIAEKPAMWTAPDDAEGLARVSAPPGREREPSLTLHQLAELARLARDIESHMGAPQDIEWAYENGRLAVLQARPVTAGAAAPGRKRGHRHVWSNINVGEALPGVATPMTWSIIEGFSRKGFEQAFGALGLRVPAGYRMVGSFRGRIYLNLTEFMAVVSQVPYLKPAKLIEWGGGAMVPELDESHERISPAGFLMRLPVTVPRVVLSHLAVPLKTPQFAAEFRALKAEIFKRPLGLLSGPELAQVLRRADKLFERTGTIMLAGASNFLSSYGLIAELLRQAKVPDAVALQPALFTGLTDVASAAPGLELLRLAHWIRAHIPLADRLRATPAADWPAVMAQSPNGKRLKTLIEGFLDRFGDRAPREAELMTARWREDPGFLYQVLKNFLAASQLPDPDAIQEAQQERRNEAERRVRDAMGLTAFRVLQPWLREAQHACRLREELRALVVETLSIYRMIFLEAGARLTDVHALSDPADVFFLTHAEVATYLSRGDTADLGLRMLVRRALFDVYERSAAPPDTFVLSHGEAPPRTGLAPRLPARGARVLGGVGGSAGVVSGPACVVVRIQDSAKLKHGDILVAPYTDVGWTPLFLTAAAVVAEVGGPLSHSCVVAREYGIPAAVNVKGAVMLIRDGDWLTVDGTHGTVTIHDGGTE